MKIGLGLWSYPTWAGVIEVGSYVIGAVLYALAVHGFKRRAGLLFWGFIIVSVVASSFRGEAMSPSSASLVAVSALVFYAVATTIIYIIEQNEREPS